MTTNDTNEQAPAGGSAQQSQLSEIDALLAAAPATPGETDPAAPPAAEVDMKPVIGLIVVTVFNLIAIRGGDHWRLHQEEVDMVAELASPVLAKHAQAVMTPEGALAVGFLGIIVPRVLKSAQRAAPPAANEGQGSAASVNNAIKSNANKRNSRAA